MAWVPGFATRVEVLTRADDSLHKPRLMEPALRLFTGNSLIPGIAEEIPAVMPPKGRESGVPIIFLGIVASRNLFCTSKIHNFRIQNTLNACQAASSWIDHGTTRLASYGLPRGRLGREQ